MEVKIREYIKVDASTSQRRVKAPTHSAFTRIELILIILTFGLLVLAALPLLANTTRRAERVVCINNLRLVGRGFHQWSTERNDFMPWWLTVGEGGTKSHANMNDLWFLYSAASNELKTPKILADPADTRRSLRQATSWDNRANGGLFHTAYQNNAVSYWLAVHATPVNPLTVISGDYNMATAGPTPGCSSQIRNLFDLSPLSIDWTNAVHNIGGSLAFMDGRVQEATRTELRQMTTFSQLRNWNNHLLFPSN